MIWHKGLKFSTDRARTWRYSFQLERKRSKIKTEVRGEPLLEGPRPARVWGFGFRTGLFAYPGMTREVDEEVASQQRPPRQSRPEKADLAQKQRKGQTLRNVRSHKPSTTNARKELPRQYSQVKLLSTSKFNLELTPSKQQKKKHSAQPVSGNRTTMRPIVLAFQ